MLGGFMAMGGKVAVIWQPWEYVIILGTALGAFVVANGKKTIMDCGAAFIDAFKSSTPTGQNHLELLSLLFAFMREIRTKPRAEIEALIDEGSASAVFRNSPTVVENEALANFVCDYVRLIIMGSARPHEIEALMDEEIETSRHDTLKSYHALVSVSDSLPAIGIIAAVLGVVKAMGAIDQAPEILGGLIASALVGTFAGIFFSYAVVGPIAAKVKMVREKKMRLYVVVKQALLAFMNGALPQIAIEHGRKAISEYERPTFNDVENAMLSGNMEASTSRKAA
jgi:chemotaxis protein MotA